MTGPFAELAEADRLIHEPARLSILTVLSASERVDFLFLRRLTGLSKGNLSSHLSKLEAAELVAVTKTFQGKVPATHLSITPKGKKAVERHWKRLEEFRASSSKWLKREQD